MYSSKAIRVSYQLLQDSGFDLPTYIAQRLESVSVELQIGTSLLVAAPENRKE